MELSKAADGARPNSRSAPLGLVLLILAMLVTGLAMVAIGSVLVAADNNLLETGSRTTGTVIDVNDGPEASDHRFAAEYSPSDASRHMVWADWAPDAKPEVGNTVTVVYRSDDPDSAVIEGHGAPGQSVLGLGVVFTVVLGGTGLMMAFAFRRGNKRRRLTSR